MKEKKNKSFGPRIHHNLLCVMGNDIASGSEKTRWHVI